MKNIGKGLKNCIGIYKITCLNNNECYIGSSVNIQDRWRQHLALLRGNRHTSPYLQHSYNKYGEDSLFFEVIAKLPNCSEKTLRQSEWAFIELYKPRFNSASPIEYERSEEWKSKISETTKKLYTEHGYVNPRKGAGRRYKMLKPNGKALYKNLTLPDVCAVLGNKDYHSINNSLRLYNIAVSKNKQFLTVPEEQPLEETMANLCRYAVEAKQSLRVVTMDGKEPRHGQKVRLRLKKEILNSENRCTYYRNRMYTLSFMPLYVETHIDNTPVYPRNLNTEMCMAT